MLSRRHPEIEAYVFILAYGRSGSTLLQALLNSLPGYCLRGENANILGQLVRVWREVNATPILNYLSRERIETRPDHPWFGGENLSPEAMGQALARFFVDEVLQPPPGTRVTGFKEIRVAARKPAFEDTLGFARRFFPGAKFIFNTRDHDQVVRSSWFADQPEAEVRAKLANCEARFDSFIAANPDSAIRVHYNDYVTDHAALRPLMDFLGEGYDPDAIARVMAQPLTHAKHAPRQPRRS